MTRLNTLLLILPLLVPAFPLTAQQDPILDPIPEIPAFTELGIMVEFVAKIPDSDNSPPRLNLLKHAHDQSGRLFINDQRGPLYIISPENEVLEYLDLRDILPSFLSAGGQRGFSSFAFHPDFQQNGLFYVVASAHETREPDFPLKSWNGSIPDTNHHDILVEFRADDPASNRFTGGEPREIMRIAQPFGDHNVGEVAFNPHARTGDPDYGMLYLAVADGGNVTPVINVDPYDNSQDPGTPLGSILRINPAGNNSANGRYGIPPDNPFVSDESALDETWAYGFRNPHRINWDPLREDRLFAYGIGQWFIEEINLVEKGGNYGWSIREGWWVLEEDNEFALYPLPEDDPEELIYPIAQYDHPGVPGESFTGFGAIAGGYVYRGYQMPELFGKLIFADFSKDDSRLYYIDTDQLDTLASGETAMVHKLRLFNQSGTEVSLPRLVRGQENIRTDVRFGIGEDREVYLMNKHNGSVYHFISSPQATSQPPHIQSYFPDAELSGDSWLIPWLGQPATTDDLPWLYVEPYQWIHIRPDFLNYWVYDHDQTIWRYMIPADKAHYLWDAGLGWIVAAPNWNSWSFSYNNQDWIQYIPGTTHPRRFFSLKENRIIDVP